MLRTPYSEAATLTQVLIALAREGVGGRFRAGYLQRRVTWDTDGAVVLEGQLSGPSGGMRSGATLHGADPHAGIDRFLAHQVWLLVLSAAFSCGMFTARESDPDGSSPQRRAERAGGNRSLGAEHHSLRCRVAGFVPVVGRTTASQRNVRFELRASCPIIRVQFNGTLAPFKPWTTEQPAP